jgi:hypothetical protein
MSTTLSSPIGVLFLCSFLSALGIPIAAQQTVSEPVSDTSPQLRISTASSVFHQGELIPLTLSFTSKNANRYQINMAGYDRSGRINYEKFLVTPTDGTKDPLVTYFKSAYTPFMVGGFTNFKFLSESPYVLHLDLNEWLRFDSPGRYRVTVTSRRVSDAPGDTSFYQGVVQDLKSNSIDLEIVAPESAWQEEQLKKILIDLDQPPSQPGPFLNESRAAALRALRYLGSPNAAQELARHLRGEENRLDWYCMFGLIGSPNRLAGYDEMKKLVIDPDFPVGGVFLDAMAVVPLDPGESEEHLRQQREANWKDARATLTSAISIKRGKALAVSVDTILQNLDPNITKEGRNQLVSLLIAHFNELAIEERRRWLEEKWPTVRDAAWLPTLRATAAEYSDYPVPYAPNVSPTYDYFKLSGDGLIRWHELDPEGARPFVLAEIVRPKPRFSANTLGMLPDKVLPNEERAIADHFLAEDGYAVEGNLASLLNRYADAAVLTEVLPKIRKKISHLWACFSENNAVTYVQRVDPEAAKPLVELVSSGCRNFPSLSDLP